MSRGRCARAPLVAPRARGERALAAARSPQHPSERPQRRAAGVGWVLLAAALAVADATAVRAADLGADGAPAASAAPAPGGGASGAPAAPGHSDAASRFDQANAAFAAGRAADAARLYRSILDADGASPALLFNLANAEFRAGDAGRAVLDYERALALAPRDRDVAANLRQVRHAANLPLPEPDPWHEIVDRLTADEWATAASAGLAVACLGAALAALLGAGATARPAGARAARAALALGLAVAIFGAVAARAALARLERGVVVGPDPVLRIAPYPAATGANRVKPGELVAIERRHEGYALIRAGDGRTGWVAEADVARVGDGIAPPANGAAAAESGVAAGR